MTEPRLDDGLCDALAARGFELRAAVRVVSFGNRKIAVIKKVRDLNMKLGLREAKQAVEQSEVFLFEVPFGFAETACEEITDAGGQAERLPTSACRYAFSPRDERRGAQLCSRVQVTPGTIELREAQLGCWDEATPIPLAVDDERDGSEGTIEAIDDLRRRWAAAGRHEAGNEIELLLALSDQNEALEQRLGAASAKGALEREATVYADWLLTQGDPRGLVGAAQLARNSSDETEFNALVEDWGAHLFGPCHKLRESWTLDWRGPLVTSATLRAERDADSHAMLEAALCLPILATVRELGLRGDCADHPELAALLDAAPCAASLRRLELGRSRSLMLRGVSFPRLHALSLDTNILPRIELHAPELLSLRSWSSWLVRDSNVDACFAGLDAPKLAHFELHLNINDYWDQHHGPIEPQLRRLLAQPSFARLKDVTLATEDDSVPLGPELVEVLRDCPARATLERIDLSGAVLSNAARRALAEARGALPEASL